MELAYYTSRVDQDGNEIERRQSARSLNIASLPSNTARTSLSSSSSSNIENLKYVNNAAYIQKGCEFSDLSDASDETRSYGSSSDPARSCLDIADEAGQVETRSDIVPPLDLRSEENFPTRRDYTFSYRKHCEAAKVLLKPEHAYETWLSAKRKTLSDEAARRKKEQEEKKRLDEERKRLAEEKYQKWLERKEQQKSKLTRQLQQRSSPPTIAAEHSHKKPAKLDIDDEEAQRKLDEWERKKRREEEKKRMQKKLEEERRAKEEGERKKLAAQAWDKWKVEAKNKPKPVPLNRGIFTLRGTISEHWVNPNEWKTD